MPNQQQAQQSTNASHTSSPCPVRFCQKISTSPKLLWPAEASHHQDWACVFARACVLLCPPVCMFAHDCAGAWQQDQFEPGKTLAVKCTVNLLLEKVHAAMLQTWHSGIDCEREERKRRRRREEKEKKVTRAGIEPTAAAPSQPTRPDVSRSDHSAASKETASWRALRQRFGLTRSRSRFFWSGRVVWATNIWAGGLARRCRRRFDPRSCHFLLFLFSSSSSLSLLSFKIYISPLYTKSFWHRHGQHSDIRSIGNGVRKAILAEQDSTTIHMNCTINSNRVSQP